MSYDLYFCRDNDIPIHREKLLKYFHSLPNMSDQLAYQNSDTGVYFSFDYTSPSASDVETIIPPGYFDTHLSFNLNYSRPKFFAEESMPIVERLCNDFGFLIIDPQDHGIGGSGSPKIAKASDLIESWLRSNIIASKIFREKGALSPYMSKERASEWWKYQYHIKKTQSGLGDSVFVPNIFLFADLHRNQVVTAISWTEGIPTVFPNCEMVIIFRYERRGLFIRKPKITMKGWINTPEIREKLSVFLTNIETDIGTLLALLPNKSEAAKPTFLGLQSNPILDRYTRISSDSFTDEVFDR